MLSIEEIKLLIEKLEKVEKEDIQELIKSNLKILKDLESAVDANNRNLVDRYDKTPKWNFYKYLFDREGSLISSWSSMTKPDHSKILKEINNTL